jgi:hypothetical protein
LMDFHQRLEEKRWKYDKDRCAWTAWFKEGTTAEDAVKIATADVADCSQVDFHGVKYKGELEVIFSSKHEFSSADK